MLGVVLAVGFFGISWSQTTIPPRTLTKKTVVIRNIDNCHGKRTTLKGIGPFDPERQKHSEYRCVKLEAQTVQFENAVAVEKTCFGRALTESFGGAGSQFIVGRDSHTDVLSGGRGNDFFLSGEKRDFICGGKGHDEANAGPGNDRCKGVEERHSC